MEIRKQFHGCSSNFLTIRTSKQQTESFLDKNAKKQVISIFFKIKNCKSSKILFKKVTILYVNDITKQILCHI